jgi:hypothetical protein
MGHIEYAAHMERHNQLRRDADRHRLAAASRPQKQAPEPERPRHRPALLTGLRPSRVS